MEIFEPTAELWKQSYDYLGMLRHIEKCGRICYRSAVKEEDNPQKFVKMLISRGHLSPLEHGTVYLTLDPLYKSQYKYIELFRKNKYSVVVEDETTRYVYVTTNYRVVIENGWEDVLEHMTSPMPLHEKRFTLFIHSDIGLSREGNRHRTFSICEQSTRYCNFSLDRFSHSIHFMKPSWWKEHKLKKIIAKIAFKCSEWFYMKLIKLGCTPQEARVVLPLATETYCVYTATEKDWKHFLDLRTTKGAHPDMQILAENIENILINETLHF